MTTTPLRIEGAQTDLMRLHQIVSPAFPIGSFAWSQGLETAILRGDVAGPGAVADWCHSVLTAGSGRCDAILLALARRSGADLHTLATEARALATSARRLTETLEQGAAFAGLARALGATDLPAAPLPVVVGAATRGLDVPTGIVTGYYLQGVAAQIVSAAVRFLPMGQRDGQRILHDLTQPLSALAMACAAAELTDLWTFTPGADLAIMEHETQDVRIFRS